MSWFPAGQKDRRECEVVARCFKVTRAEGVWEAMAGKG